MSPKKKQVPLPQLFFKTKSLSLTSIFTRKCWGRMKDSTNIPPRMGLLHLKERLHPFLGCQMLVVLSVPFLPLPYFQAKTEPLQVPSARRKTRKPNTGRVPFCSMQSGPYTLSETNMSHLKRGRIPKGKEKVFQPSIFGCKLLVQGVC